MQILLSKQVEHFESHYEHNPLLLIKFPGLQFKHKFYSKSHRLQLGIKQF